MTDQPYLPGTEPVTDLMPKSAIMVIRNGQPSEVFPDMAALKLADLLPGDYKVWRYGGIHTVEQLPARTRTRFKSAHSKPHGPRKPRAPRKPRTAMKGANSGPTA